MDIYEKGKGNNYIYRKESFLLVQITVILIVNNVLNFLSSSHNHCFLVIFSKVHWGIMLLWAQSKSYFAIT